VNERVDRRVKLNILKVPPIAPIELLVKEVNCPAFETTKSPVICCGPLKSTVPEASGPMRTLPEMVEQEAY